MPNYQRLSMDTARCVKNIMLYLMARAYGTVLQKHCALEYKKTGKALRFYFCKAP
jgi:hypothetical protein